MVNSSFFENEEGFWEVRRYNGAHTCLEATEVSIDHRHYHMISVFIMPTEWADATITIKVLQNATDWFIDLEPMIVQQSHLIQSCRLKVQDILFVQNHVLFPLNASDAPNC
ncbi:hypothetical protein PIB30_016549 [Stylosanthes scabra]|uniref:Uncharacterized protein n=1 Tax=Stylosanthes scabra TaxID=79078 RepID=A0ABU6R7L6_9FABA|nr:hypothetical protein [Stylosanthes scabra]